MSSRHSIPMIIGVLLAIVAGIVIVTAMFVVDQGEEMLHLYKDYKSLSRRSNPGGGSGDPSGMELRGHWLGMSLTGLGGPAAAQLGAPRLEHGLVVAGIDVRRGQRAKLAGVRIGDVLTGVDHKPIEGLAGLHKVSQTMVTGQPVMLDVYRNGRAVTLVVPAERLQAQPAAFNGPQYYCPRDGILVPSAGAMGAGHTCPRCAGPLRIYQPPNAGAPFPGARGGLAARPAAGAGGGANFGGWAR